MSAPRLHHWIPQFYLARVTENGAKDSKLFVVDLPAKKSFSTIPRNVCAERDFNRVESPDFPADALETSLSRFEAAVAGSMAEVIEHPRTFSAEAWHYTVNFMSVLAARSPFTREYAALLTS